MSNHCWYLKNCMNFVFGKVCIYCIQDILANVCGEMANHSWISLTIGPNAVATVVENGEGGSFILELILSTLNGRWYLMAIAPNVVASVVERGYVGLLSWEDPIQPQPNGSRSQYFGKSPDLICVFVYARGCACMLVSSPKFWMFI